MAYFLVTGFISLCMLATLDAFTYRTKDVYFNTDPDLRDKDDGIQSQSVSWQDAEQKTSVFHVSKRKCSCSRPSSSYLGCRCCTKITLKTFTMEGCAGFVFVSSAKALDFTVTIDSKVVVKKRISVTTDVKFCHDFPIHENNSTVCLGLRKISLEEQHAGACMFMTIDYKTLIHWDQDIGCIYQRRKTTMNIY